MSTNAHLNIARTFKRADPVNKNGHPMRGTLAEKVQREHLLRRDEDDIKREKVAMIRDTVISVMGAVSALVPLMIAFKSVTGA
jgi:hypothetical protein